MRDQTIVTVINPDKDSTTGGPRKPKDACLVVIYGQDLGRKYNITGGEITVGRATSNDICLSQDAVSRVHARLIIDEQGVRLRDNESTNGTYVNDNKIHEAYLQDGDLVKIGRSIFKFLTGENIESSYHEEIFRLSTVDGLTQVYNRRYFMETLERELSRARRYERPLGLLIFDIDHFKKTNDTFGHRAGDHVLRRVADLVTEDARKVDVVSRYGGEEFTVILPEVGLEGARLFAEKIRKLIETEDFSFEGRKIPVNISIGVAELDESIAAADDMIKTADRRLYAAKEGGRNRTVAEG
jgi:diguanylate cyclase (GGDEF)-like protein